MSETLRILLLEDRAADAELVTNKLREGGLECSVVRVAAESEFLTELRNPALDLILADYSLPAYDGLSALAAAQEQRPETPFIFVSGSLGEERAIEALHRGATDYVLKDRLARLQPAVRRALRECEEIRKRNEADQQRREAESRFRTLFEQSPDGIVIIDPATARILEFNDAAHRQLGYSREEFAHLTIRDLEAAEAPEETWARIAKAIREGKDSFETHQRTRQGVIKDIHVTAQMIEVSGRPVYHCIWRDITERKQAEERVREVNLVLRASSAINALMVRERDPGRLLAKACNVLVETRGYRLAWIGTLEPSSKRVLPVAKAGKDANFLDSATITWDETPTGQGPIGTAIRTGQPTACLDTATDPIFAPWKEAAKKYGLASMAAMPLIHGARALGAVAVYADRTGMFDGEEIKLLAELASDLAFALQSIEHEQERKRAEELQRESERRYRLLFNSGYDAVLVHAGPDAQGRPGKFLEVNEVACKRLGYTRDELLQLSPLEIDAPESAQAIPGTMKRLMREKHGTWEAVNLRKNGTRFPVEISSELFDLNGKPTFLSIVRDITERERAQAHLRLLREALESAANAILITDCDGIIIWANAAFTALSGYTVEEALGQTPSLFKSGQHDQAFYQRLWETVLAGRVWSAEMVNRRKDGTFYTEENTITPVHNEKGEITHFVAVKQDITERKRSEEALREQAKLAALEAEVGTALTRGGTLADMLRLCSEAIVRHLDAAFARIWTLNEPEQMLELQASAGLYTHLDGPHGRVPVGKYKIGLIAEQRKAHLVNQVAGDPRVGDPEWARREGLVAFAGYPLLVEDRAVGVVAMFARHTLSEVRLAALGSIANNIALGVERKRAETALRQREEYYRALTERATDIRTILSRDGTIQYESPSVEQVFDYTPEELVGRSVFELIHPEDLARVHQTLAELVATPGASARTELRYRHKDGSWRVLEATTRNLLEDPSVKGLVANSRDVTERKQLEEALRESSQFNQQIIASAQEGIVVYGRDLKYQVWNPFMERLTGRPASEVLGKHPDELFPSLREAGLLAAIEKILAGEPASSIDLHIERLPGGTATWTSQMNGPLRNAAGEIFGVIGIVRDMTERKQAEEVLRASEQRFRQLAENIESVFWMASATLDRMLYISPAYERIWGRTTASLYEDPGSFLEAIHPEDRARVVEHLQQKHLAKPEEFTIEYRVVRPDGSVRWVRDRGFPIMNAAGQLDRMVGIAEDITESKRAELRIAAFANLGQRLNAAKTAKEAGKIIVEVADTLLGWDSCLFHLYSAAENRVSSLLTMDIIDGRRAECVPTYVQRVPTESAKRAIQQGGQLVLRDSPATTRPEAVPFGDTSRASASLMFVPIRHGTEVVGILSIQSYTPKAYDAYSLETLQALADHGGGALERLRAQEALSESEANFRSVWEHSLDGMRLTDWAGRIVAVNEAYCRLVRLPRAKLEGQIISVAYKGHGPNDGIDVYQKRFANEDIRPHDTRRAELWNSEVVDLEISNSFIEMGQRGKMLLSIFRDVSERRRAELRIGALSKLGQRLSAAKSVREAAVIISEVAGELLGWDACSFSLLSASRELLDHVLQVDTVGGRRMEENPGYEPPSEMARRTIESGAQLVVKEQPDQALPGTQPFGNSARPSASILYVPVRQGAHVVGTMSIHSYTPGAYDERSLETLQALADHCGGALERLRIQEAWQNSQQQLAHLLTQSPAVIYSLKTDGKTAEPVWVSDNVERLLGYRAAECHGPEGLFKKVHPQDRQDRIDSLVELFAARQVVRDYRVRHKNGEYRWVRDEQRLVCDAAGAPAEIVGSWTDITERKRAERGQEESERRFREMLENVELIAMTLDTKGAITFCNDHLLRITGWQRAETIGADWFSCFVPETHLEVKETFFDNVAAGTIPSHYENPIRTRKGELRQIVWNNTMLRDAAGNVSGVASIGEDITERNVLEEQLRQAQKLEAVGQLAGGVAHDFNNMLAVIRGNAELLLMDEGQCTAETKEGLKQVVGASERAANLTRQLLAFSRKQVLQPQPLVLNDVIANLTKMVSRVIGENIDLQCHYAAPLAHVHADTGMMEQIILNLVVNARDAMPEGGRLVVATEQHHLDEAQAQAQPGARAGDYVCLVVSDTGSGIAPEVLPRIFEPFFTTKEVGKGTGLGLATVYGIVQQHQGWLEVSSQVGQGSSFKVFLPAIATPARQAASAEAGGDARSGKERILLVEDDHAVRLTTRRVLESRGYSVQEASSGREALEQWQRHSGEFALLLTDIIMPGEMTGRDLAERLWESTPGLRVVFISGYSANVVGRDTEFIRRTQSQFLQKPCSSRVLLETVRHCLDGRASVAASGEGNSVI